MNIEQLINKLEKLKETEGNLDVRVYDWEQEINVDIFGVELGEDEGIKVVSIS